MRILIINISNFHGGASRAAARLHESMLDIGVDSIFYSLKGSQYVDRNYYVVYKWEKGIYFLAKVFQKFLYRVFLKHKTNNFTYFSVDLRFVKRAIKRFGPDIVHFHWTDDIFFNRKSLKHIQVPILFSLHDLHVVTGGCHYPGECLGSIDGCNQCPLLKTKFRNVASKRVKQFKSFSSNKNITLVGLSNWISLEANSTVASKNVSVVNLPNPIDVDFYKPNQSKVDFLNVPRNKKVILYGAMSADSDPRKGYFYLKDALKYLNNKSEIVLVCFGTKHKSKISLNGIETINIGYIDNDHTMVELYNLATVLVVPSLEENLSNTIMEGMSCGTPVVAFDIGGNSDMIIHGKTGYLAEERNAESLSNCLEKAMENSDELGQNARAYICSQFNRKEVAKRYKDYYSMISND